MYITTSVQAKHQLLIAAQQASKINIYGEPSGLRPLLGSSVEGTYNTCINVSISTLRRMRADGGDLCSHEADGADLCEVGDR